MSCLIQDVSVVEQEKIDKLMLDMDGTENKCKKLLSDATVLYCNSIVSVRAELYELTCASLCEPRTGKLYNLLGYYSGS